MNRSHMKIHDAAFNMGSGKGGIRSNVYGADGVTLLNGSIANITCYTVSVLPGFEIKTIESRNASGGIDYKSFRCQTEVFSYLDMWEI